MELDLLIRDGMICRDDSPPARSSLGVRDGRIAVIAARAVGLDAKEVIDAGERLVMPGMIDPHVHIGHGAPHASAAGDRPPLPGGGRAACGRGLRVDHAMARPRPEV